MKLRISPNIHNNDRIRKKALKEVRQPIEDSLLAKALKRLFKVKYATNDILYDSPENSGGHYVLTVATEKLNDDIVVSELNSIENANGNPTKQERIEKKFLFPLPEDKVSGSSKRNAVGVDLYTKNKKEERKLKFSDLDDPNNQIIISEDVQQEVAKHIFENEMHRRISKRNQKVTKSMIKIK